MSENDSDSVTPNARESVKPERWFCDCWLFN